MITEFEKGWAMVSKGVWCCRKTFGAKAGISGIQPNRIQ